MRTITIEKYNGVYDSKENMFKVMGVLDKGWKGVRLKKMDFVNWLIEKTKRNVYVILEVRKL
jgi:hypothetical protein